MQGSYISPDADASTETFNSFTGSGESCASRGALAVGEIVGGCAVYDNIDLGASDTGTGQVIGGSGSVMATGGGSGGASFKINFTQQKRYIGFWWSAGSPGNSVNFYSKGAVIATINVNQVFDMFGTPPYYAAAANDPCIGQPGETATASGDKCFGNTLNVNDSSAVVTSKTGTKYLKNIYFGNPNGYSPPSGGPSNISPSLRVFSEPFVYIHAFALNGADFDAVEFAGPNFEMDNLTVANAEKTPRDELVFVQTVSGSYVASFNSQGGTDVSPGAFTSGGSLNAPSNPTRAGYAFAGWSESTTSTTGLSFPYSPGVDSDITLYAKWFRYSGISPTNGLPSGSWITLNGENLSHSYSNGFGYQTVYFRSVADVSGSSPGSWTALTSGEIRDGSGTSIEVMVPALAGVNFYQFLIDVCRNWTTNTDCVSLNNSAVYSIPTQYSVTYDGNLKTSGSVPIDSSGPYVSGDTVTILSNSGALTRSGYTFSGWNTLANGNGSNYLSNGADTLTISSSDVLLFAKWTADTHTATFDSQGGSAVSPITFFSDGSVSLPASPTRSGFSFNGWFINSTGGSALSTPYFPGVFTDVTIYGQWTQDAPPPPPSGGGSGSSSNSSTLLPDPKVPGVSWLPANMVEGDLLGDQQMNAVFSVPGTSVYSPPPGFKAERGSLQITVTFTPDDKASYMVLSTSRTIEVEPKPTLTPTRTPTPIPTPIPTPKTIKISQLKLIGIVYFNNNEYFLDAKDRSKLVEVAAQINNARYETVVIQGNTDLKLGVDNYRLSQARAEAVSKYLSKIEDSPFYNSVWYASKRPVALGLDKKSLAKNRRVEIYAKVIVEQPFVSAISAPKVPVKKSFKGVTFNRNESFLDAQDRKYLVTTVQNLAKLGCTRVYLKGSHDQAKSSVNAYIGTNRVNAVRKFMSELLPTLKFTVEPEFVSSERVVQIRCSN